MRRGILGIDFGTTKVAAVLVDPDSGEVLCSKSKNTGAYVECRNPAYAEQDVERIKDTFDDVLADVVSIEDVEIVSIGLTGQMHGILGIGKDGLPVTNLVTWQDGRGDIPGRDGKTTLERMRERAGERPVATGYGVVTLFDWAERGGLGEVDRVCTVADYFASVLTGKPPVMDFSMAHSLGCLNDTSTGWDMDYLDRLGIKVSVLPPLVKPASVAGECASGTLDLQDPVPVSAALGDNQASFVGSVSGLDSTILINIGTGAQISLALSNDGPVTADGYDLQKRPFVEDRILLAGGSLAGGAVYAALRDFFARTGRELFGLSGIEDAELWKKMEESALRALHDDTGSETDGLVVTPLFAGRRSSPQTRGTIEGMSLDNFTPANLIKGILLGMVRVLEDLVDQSLLARRPFLVGSGNAIRRNEALRACAELVFGKKPRIPKMEEEAAVGAALAGAVGCRVFPDFAGACALVRYNMQGGAP